MISRACRVLPVCFMTLLLTSCGQEDQPDRAAAAKRPPVLADKSWPNVILISIDALRPDHLHCYGYARETSPHIDRLAREGALFENVISSSSWSLPAHACLFTGLADSVHGCLDSDQRLHADHYTLAERLKDTGYGTAGFFSGPYLHPVFGLNQGFDDYIDCISYPQSAGEPATTSPTTSAADMTNPTTLRAVESWLTQNTHRPFFMFIHMWDVHFDYTPPPPYDTMFDPGYDGAITGRDFLRNPQINEEMPKRDLEHLIALYDGEIAWTDAHVGKLLETLEKRELLDTSIIVLTAGHGTAFFEHGKKGHGNSLFDELIRIPLIIRYPRAITAGARHDQQIRMIDLLPTVLDLLGIPPPELMGQSLAPLFMGGTTQRDEPAISELLTRKHKLRCFRRPDRKRIWHIAVNAGVVYDLQADPAESTPLADRNAPVVKATKADAHWSGEFLKAFRQRHPQSPRLSELPATVLERLESLGYLGGEDFPMPGSTP